MTIFFHDRKQIEAVIAEAEPHAAARMQGQLRRAIRYWPMFADPKPTFKDFLRLFVGKALPRAIQPAQSNAFPTHLGGLPRLTENGGWPRHNGLPLSFVGRFETDPNLEFGSSKDALQFFIGRNMYWYVQIEYETGTLTTWPDDLAAKQRYPFVPLKSLQGWSLPMPKDGDFLTSNNHRKPDSVYEYTEPGSNSLSDYAGQLGGWSQSVQGEIFEDVGSEGLFGYASSSIPTRASDTSDDPWRLVAQINSVSEARMNWGDGGVLCFMVRQSELKAGRFEHTLLAHDSA